MADLPTLDRHNPITTDQDPTHVSRFAYWTGGNMEGRRVMDDVQLQLTGLGLEQEGDDLAPIPFPQGGVFGLDSSHIEAAEDALERIDFAIRRLDQLAQEEQESQEAFRSIVLGRSGNDDGPPRAA